MGVLKDIGGFYNSLFFVGLFIYSRFQGTIIFSSMVSKLYQIEQVDENEDDALNGPPNEVGKNNLSSESPSKFNLNSS